MKFNYIAYFTAPGHLLSNQAAVEAVLNAATTRRGAHQTGTHMEGEPQAKRPALGVEFASLVKETVFDSQQVCGSQGVCMCGWVSVCGAPPLA